MSRIRTIKPEILDDERTSALTSDAFRLFIGLITLADDLGNARGHLGFLEGHIFWALPSPPPVRPLAAELERAGLIQSYLVRGQVYIAILGWSKHQKVDKPGPARMPGPELAERTGIFLEECVANDSRIAREPFAPDLDHDPDQEIRTETTIVPTPPTARAREGNNLPDSERLFQGVRSRWVSAGLEAMPVFDAKERAAFYANFVVPRQKGGLTEDEIAIDADLFVENVLASSIAKQRSFHSIMSKPGELALVMSGDRKDWSRVEKKQPTAEEILAQPLTGGGSGLRARAQAMREARERGGGPVIETTAELIKQLGSGGDS